MATPEERLDEAATMAEAATAIAKQWANGPENTTIPTESGPLPTLAEFMRRNAEGFADAAGLRDDLADGTANVGGVQASRLAKTVIQVTHLKALPISGLTDGQQFSVAGFYDGINLGGGKWIYDSTRSMLDHDGFSVIATPALSAWSGESSDLQTFLNWTGFGVGCFVKLNSNKASVDIHECGALPDNDVAFIVNHAYAKDVRKVRLSRYSYYLEDTITVPHDRHLAGVGNTITDLKLRSGMVDKVCIRYGASYFYQGYRGSLKKFGISADGDFEKRGIGIFFNSGCDVEDVDMFELKSAFVLTGNNYTDRIGIKRCYIGYCGGHPTYHVVHLDGPGDALQIEQTLLQLSYTPSQPPTERDGVYISRFRGATLSANVINGNLKIRRCDAVNINGHHAEGSQDDVYKTNLTNITIERSNVTIDGVYIHKCASGPTIRIKREVVGSTHETGSVSLKNINIDTTILLKGDLAGTDIPDLETSDTSIVDIENVYRQETYAFGQTQPKTGIKVAGNDFFNRHSSYFSKRSTIHPSGKVSNGIDIGFNGVERSYNRNQFTNSNPNLPFYEEGASGKTFYIRTILVVDETRKLATNINSQSQAVNNVTTGPIGTGRGILVNTTNSPLTDGLGATVYYYRGDAINSYTKLAKAPTVLAQFTYDTGLDYQGYPFESRAAGDVDVFNYVKSYKVDSSGRVTFEADQIPNVGTFTEGDTVINTNKTDWSWQSKVFSEGQWVDVARQTTIKSLESAFAYRYAPYFNGTTAYGQFTDRLINVDSDIDISFRTGLVVLGRTQGIVSQQQTTTPASREFALFATSADTFSVWVGGLESNSIVCKLKENTKYRVSLIGSTLRFYENDILVETRVLNKGAAREPSAVTAVACLYTSSIDRNFFFAGQLFDISINNNYYPADRRDEAIQFSVPTSLNNLTLFNVSGNSWIKT